jgi:polar amino acid transport system substrate-binding protein
MKQLIQNFKTGELYVDEIPAPAISDGMVLVENEFSLISSGTERGTVKVAQAGLIGKARQRPDLVAQVLQNIKREGIAATLTKVRTKLDSLKALGYSSAGRVIASMDRNGVFKPGDRVACGGQDYASHAGIVTVPQNLVVKIPENVTFEEASFATLGAIAMQGVRQASLTLGEKVCVIGLGLLGQISCQLLKASGCSVFGIDISDRLVRLANGKSADFALTRGDENLLAVCSDFTHGQGFDAVIITAAAQSNDPVELAAEISRKKGRIIVVGAVKMDLQREPHFYKKDLDLRMSCSYGPGRYDTQYEEAGHDYPYAYVRWTEQRNMESFLELLARKAIDVKPLISHVFDISEAAKAYNIVMEKTGEFYSAILLRYSNIPEERDVHFETLRKNHDTVNVGFIGAGSFAQGYLIPYVQAFGARLEGVVTTRGITSKNVAGKFGFNYSSTNIDDVLNDANINTIFIATPHSSHAGLAIRALEAGKNVFVEKPLAINAEQLRNVIIAKNKFHQPLTVGFNRRYAPVSESIKNEFRNISEPLVINIRVNAGLIPKDNWIQDPEIGGGRIVGEMCHFIDLMQFFTGSDPVRVFAESIATDNTLMTPYDNIAVTVRFKNGSVGNLVYVANGDKALPKEKIEVFGAGNTGIINDFHDGAFLRNGKAVTLKSSGKGHREEVQSFINVIQKGSGNPLSFRSICLTTIATIKILDSLYTGFPQEINLDNF